MSLRGATYRFATTTLLAAMLSFNGSIASARVLVAYESDGQTYFSLSVPDEWMIATGFEAVGSDVSEKTPYILPSTPSGCAAASS